ncbi:MAG: tail fiber domain-containing protein, partial [Sphingomicrobium sp.]
AWLKNRAITLGCSPTQYCPNQFVYRYEMALFLYRLGFENAFLEGGNAFGTTAILGTTDNRALEIHVNGSRALLVAPAISGFGSVPNLVGGHPANKAAVTCIGICIPTPQPVAGAVIGGGGPTLGGLANRVTDSFGVIGGGSDNQAGNNDADHFNAWGATVGGGVSNEASGAYSTVPGGLENNASGDFSFAAGRRAKAFNPGCFVWADDTDVDFSCFTTNGFGARATGGVLFVTGVSASGAPTAGVGLLAGDSSWNVLSDGAAKMNWRDVDGREVLERLATMPIGEWNYRAQSDAIRHMGPSAQDFRAAFGLGHSDLTISTVDADGVALAAIQGLNRKL